MGTVLNECFSAVFSMGKNMKTGNLYSYWRILEDSLSYSLGGTRHSRAYVDKSQKVKLEISEDDVGN